MIAGPWSGAAGENNLHNLNSAAVVSGRFLGTKEPPAISNPSNLI